MTRASRLLLGLAALLALETGVLIATQRQSDHLFVQFRQLQTDSDALVDANKRLMAATDLVVDALDECTAHSGPTVHEDSL